MAYQFKIELKGFKNPKIWREVVVNEKMTFHNFHGIIQICMGWEDDHAYKFSPRGNNSYPTIKLKTSYLESEYSPFSDLGNGYDHIYDSAKTKLCDYFSVKGQKIMYIYDFGDDWSHVITLKKIWPGDTDHPMLVAGEGRCPPEDCGGVWGYQGLLKTINDPSDPEYEERREWLGLERGEVWDAAEFDVARVNNWFMGRKEK